MIALSDHGKDQLSMIVPSERIEVIENYSSLNEYAVNVLANRKRNLQILFLGKIDQNKGCYDIPEVAKRVVEKFPKLGLSWLVLGILNRLKRY